MPGQANLNPNGRPRGMASIEQIREKYGHRVPELIENLFELTRTGSEATKLAANRELLDRIVGRPQQVIEAHTTRLDVGAMYLQALQRANANGSNAVDITHDGDMNGSAGGTSDPTEIQ
jgi:hypothetical protein